MRKCLDLFSRGRDQNELGIQHEGHYLLLAAVEAAREYAQSFGRNKQKLSVGVLNFTRVNCGLPQQMGALSITCYCDHCHCLPLRDCTWTRLQLESRQSDLVVKTWIGAKCSSLEHGLPDANGKS